MRVFDKYGSKERLFEMMNRVNNLNEDSMSIDKRDDIVDKFIKFVDSELELNGEYPEIKLVDDVETAKEMKSYGRYMPDKNELLVVTANRALADSLRTIAHELVHHKQGIDGKLNNNSGATGSPEENEANAVAGVIMRKFGKENPEIY
jgi:Zn-dependent peptidase ImmA (M78 family)